MASPFTRQRAQSVSALGESGLIRQLRRWLGTASPAAPAGIGDDCAVIAGSPRDQFITVDPVIYGEHFDDSVPPEGVAAKLFNRNLSDVAAMGGRPRAAVVALALTPRVKRAWLETFYRSLARIARRHHVPIIGGDVASQPNGITATMTLVGECAGGRAVTRHGAREGDWIFTTGRLGGSLLGWHWKFQPRLAEGPWLASRAEVRAMMDVSDGLAKDLASLTPRGCRPSLSAAAIPISPSAKKMAAQSGRPALAHALTDGEDYELLFAVNGGTNPVAFQRAWQDRFDLRLSCIGQFKKARARSPYPDEIKLADFHGFEHLR